MKYINKKQKIVLIIVIFIITLGVSYYAYETKSNKEIDIEEQNLEIDENKVEEKSKEEKTSKIIVHVSGAVNKEGIFELEENSRVADAIEAAGGIKENAYMKNINLASLLEDGMKVYIPTKEECENQESMTFEGSIINEEKINTREQDNEIEQKNKNSKININTANLEELDTLPGIGESTANKIINYRKENGKFETIEEIKEVSGIGDSKFEQIKDLIEV